MPERPYNVLFLCTHNSARSIMAEALLNRLGAGRFKAYSAGSQPSGRVHPLALQVLAEADLLQDGLSSKAWDEFAVPGAPVMDFVFTVCDDAAGEVCPVWPGQPITAHWGIEDPSRVQGTEIQREAAFVTALRYLRNRVAIFTSLPLGSLDQLAIGAKVREIGHADGASSRRPSAA